MNAEGVLLDKDIREPLFEYLESYHGKVRFLEEKVTGKARADIVMILPGEICGIEIKSDADSYTRLPSQIKYYDRFFDRNYIVAGSSHGSHMAFHVPPYWGIITVEWIGGAVDFYRLREAGHNPKVRLDAKLSLLWQQELGHILSENGLPKYTGKSRKFIVDKLMEKVPKDILDSQASEELFERDYTLLLEKPFQENGFVLSRPRRFRTWLKGS